MVVAVFWIGSEGDGRRKGEQETGVFLGRRGGGTRREGEEKECLFMCMNELCVLIEIVCAVGLLAWNTWTDG